MQPLPPPLAELIDKLVSDEGQLSISISGTLKRTCAKYPDCPAPDEDLMDYIATRAVSLGLAIEFDAPEQRRPTGKS